MPIRDRRIWHHTGMLMPSALVLVLAWMMSACAPRYPYVWVGELSEGDLQSDQDVASGPLRPNDRIYVNVRGQPDFSAEHDVQADGSIAQPSIGRVAVGDQSPQQVAKIIQRRLTGILIDPKVEVSVVSRRVPRINVVGEIQNPGVVELNAGDRLLDVLAQVGGITEFAAKNHIYVLRAHPRRIRIRFRYDELIRGEKRSSAFRLRDGDVLVVE